MSQHSASIADLSYATPMAATTSKGPRALAGGFILFGGLGLVGLGGCFLIGILITIQHMGFNGVVQQMPLTPSEIVFVAVLSLLSLMSLCGAALLLYLGTRTLLRVALS